MFVSLVSLITDGVMMTDQRPGGHWAALAPAAWRPAVLARINKWLQGATQPRTLYNYLKYCHKVINTVYTDNKSFYLKW